VYQGSVNSSIIVVVMLVFFVIVDSNIVITNLFNCRPYLYLNMYQCSTGTYLFLADILLKGHLTPYSARDTLSSKYYIVTYNLDYLARI